MFMRYLLAVLLPPAAVLLCGRPRLLFVSVVLTAGLWLPGAVHALLVVRDAATRARADRLADVVLALEDRLRRARRRGPIPAGG
jgi:uncharacterized membrane protein YqaE (UPF0057 family)